MELILRRDTYKKIILIVMFIILALGFSDLQLVRFSISFYNFFNFEENVRDSVLIGICVSYSLALC